MARGAGVVEFALDLDGACITSCDYHPLPSFFIAIASTLGHMQACSLLWCLHAYLDVSVNKEASKDQRKGNRPIPLNSTLLQPVLDSKGLLTAVFYLKP